MIKRAWSPKIFLGASPPDPLLPCPEHKSDFGLDPLLEIPFLFFICLPKHHKEVNTETGKREGTLRQNMTFELRKFKKRIHILFMRNC